MLIFGKVFAIVYCVAIVNTNWTLDKWNLEFSITRVYYSIMIINVCKSTEIIITKHATCIMRNYN